VIEVSLRSGIAACLVCLGSCTSGSVIVAYAPAPAGLSQETLEGYPFRHTVFRGHATGGEILHVYLEGDGVPYTGGRSVAKDPTSRSGLMIGLMAADPSPSIYIGRPCYLGLSIDRACNAHYWTDCRFSPAVIGSMRKVLTDEIIKFGAKNVVLIGHSGGAAIAVLLAHDVTEVSAVITLAGNLDIDAWARMHGYAPLACSLNPAVRGPLPPRVKAIHLVGADDRVTPPEFITRAAATTGGRVIVLPGFTHTCCWREQWPALLQLSLRADDASNAESEMCFDAATHPAGTPPGGAGTNKNSPLRCPASASTEYRGL
jgi:predicted alpha/beta hydrolase family esterase